MWLKWFPWRYVVKRAARARGFVDPLEVMARLYRFAEPSEVAAPMELLRAGVTFHARGLMNTRAIQHNLDWVWPYWVQRQFNPRDSAFIPRAFSLTHINLTCRNWTAVGVPDVDLLPIVDPAGLVTPHWDGWSLDAWLLCEDGPALIPARCELIEQRWDLGDELAVVTRTAVEGLQLMGRCRLVIEEGSARCRQTWTAAADRPAWLVVSLRPYNPEGVSFVHRVALDPARRQWTVDDSTRVLFAEPAERHHASTYRQGDVFLRLFDRDEAPRVECEVGMATAAAMYAVEPGRERTIGVDMPLGWPVDLPEPRRFKRGTAPLLNRPDRVVPLWPEALQQAARLEIPRTQFTFLYEAALRTLVLHTPGEAYPGPFTYKRFWVRDTAFIVHALLAAGLVNRAARILPRLLARQQASGYFLSQEGEWDANGEALWTLRHWSEMSGQRPPTAWQEAIRKGARWIVRKRTSPSGTRLHAGLLPAGFSAEHLGPNDYYYWDDFWGVAGLRSAAGLLGDLGEPRLQAEFLREADDFLAAIERSLRGVEGRLARPALPASPYRRMDAGAIGSLAAGYPLRLFGAVDPRLVETARFLRENCFVQGGFFQDMIHSGINAYLTLHVAQVLLRAGDPSWIDLVEAVAELASPTGQWPEAIHPHTGGGCMGDGHHVWAAAEWVVAMRNAFVREESDRLILASGIPPDWLTAGTSLRFGPTPTPWGPITVTIDPGPSAPQVRWTAQWRGVPPPIEVRLPNGKAGA